MIADFQKAYVVTLVLTEEDVRRMAEDPSEVQGKILELLDDEKDSDHKYELLGGKVSRPKEIAAPNSKESRGVRVPCEICDKLIASHMMPKHLRTRHPDTVGAESD